MSDENGVAFTEPLEPLLRQLGQLGRVALFTADGKPVNPLLVQTQPSEWLTVEVDGVLYQTPHWK